VVNPSLASCVLVLYLLYPVTVAPDFVATSQNSFVYWQIETRPLPAAEEKVAGFWPSAIHLRKRSASEAAILASCVALRAPEIE